MPPEAPLEWTMRQYGVGGETHAAENQKWEVIIANGKKVEINFAQFANKHFLKPSSKGLKPEQKATRLWEKRSRTSDNLKAHHRMKYGAATPASTVIDLSKIELRTVVKKFAEALMAERFRREEEKTVHVDLGVPRCLIITNPERDAFRPAGADIYFKASKNQGSGNSFKVWHLERPPKR
jgi:hypothetical protein